MTGEGKSEKEKHDFLLPGEHPRLRQQICCCYEGEKGRERKKNERARNCVQCCQLAFADATKKMTTIWRFLFFSFSKGNFWHSVFLEGRTCLLQLSFWHIFGKKVWTFNPLATLFTCGKAVGSQNTTCCCCCCCCCV